MSMDRRSFLKLASVTGAGLVAASLPFRIKIEAAPQFIMVTENPDQDVNRLLQTADLSSVDNMHVTTTLVQPSAQDLTIMWNGHVTDPLKEESLPLSVRSFAGILRRRKNDGQFLVTIGNVTQQGSNLATFESDGMIVDQISLDDNYNSIVIPGKFGDTRFQIQDGKVSVVQSSCGHHLCENIGAVHNGRIVCAPNKLFVSVGQGNNRVDSITG